MLTGVDSSLSEDNAEKQNKVMDESALELLRDELLKYRSKEMVESILTRIEQGAGLPAEDGYCDLRGANTGSYMAEDAAEWIKEIEKYQRYMIN
jgi:hypothetical protein|tara:strand:+ start:650 stop:931 length:282 start_codon:yes stop_codon:yes gene_type:complete